MNSKQVAAFLKALSVKNIEGSDTWVRGSCPLAPFSHSNGVDSHPSFAVKVMDDHPSHFNCYVCSGGSLENLIHRIEMGLYQQPELRPLYDLKTASAILDGVEKVVVELPLFEQAPNLFNMPPSVLSFPDDWLASFPLAFASVACRDYLTFGRSDTVPYWVIKKFDLRYDPNRNMVVSPYWDINGRLVGARGRSIDPTCPKEFRHHDYTWNGINNARLVWMNEQMLQDTGPVVVVEGQFDLYRMAAITSRVIAGLTTKNTEYKMRKLLQSELVIWMLDNDKPGQDHSQQYRDWLHQKGVPSIVLLYSGKDPDAMNVQEAAYARAELSQYVDVF